MLTISILFQLLSKAVTLRRDKSVLYSRTAINILLYCIYSSYFMRKTIKAIGLFGGLFQTTSITKVFHIFFFLISATILQLTAYYPRKFLQAGLGKLKELPEKLKTENKISIYKSFLINKMAEQFKILEYSLIILFIISGAILLMSSTDLISMFLSIELQSYGLYILSTIYKNSESSTKAGLTYFLLGGLSSCFILLGTSLLYSNTATTNLEGIYIINSLTEIYGLDAQNNVYDANYINISLIIMAVGFLFKVSAAPFHFWSPDVYDAIPTVVTTFVAIVAKISIFIFLLELLQHTARSFDFTGENLDFEARFFEFTWVNSLMVSCLLSLIIGSVLGLTQNRIKRLFAYSTISHVGFILLALSIDSVESIQAFLFYLMQYSLTNLNAFIILISIGYSYYLAAPAQINIFNNSDNKLQEKSPSSHKKEDFEELDKNNSPIQFTKEIRGLFYLNPVLAISLTITVFSFAGIPPLMGFFGKQMILSAALDSGYYFLTLIAILTSVVSAVYYLNIVKEIFFFPSIINFSKKISENKPLIISLDSKNIVENSSFSLPDVFPGKTKASDPYKNADYIVNNSKLVLSSYLTITISLLTLAILLFIFVPKEWLSMANVLALNLFNT